jgi:hypothetical protein
MKKPNHLINAKKRSKDEVEAEINENLLAIDCYQKRWMEGVPLRYRLEASRILAGKTTAPKKYIKMKCLDCVGFEDANERIKGCRVTICPLWKMRPFK